jgi:hypothetical protein
MHPPTKKPSLSQHRFWHHCDGPTPLHPTGELYDDGTNWISCFGKQTATGPREFGIHESDGTPDEKEGRPKQQPPGYQACVMRGEMWPRRQETFPCPDASPPRCAQLMGLASRGCLVLVLGATAERRNLLFRSDLGLPWIRTLSLPRLSRQVTAG